MSDQAVELNERTGVEEQLDALPRGQLSAGVLLIDSTLATTEQGLLVEFLKLLKGIGLRLPYHSTCAVLHRASQRGASTVVRQRQAQPRAMPYDAGGST